MGRMRTPTAANRHIGRELQKKIAADIIAAYTAGLEPMRKLSAMDPETVTWDDGIDALRALRQSRRLIEKLQLDLMGAVTLSGGTVNFLAAEDVGVGISASTLTRRLPRTPAVLIGRELVWDPSATYGWRALE
jgi:hypothetical protein